MRSIHSKTGLALIILSLSGAGAFAAAIGQNDTDSGDGAPPVISVEPRAEIVLGQLESTVDGIRMESAARNIPADKAAQLEQEASRIRSETLQVAAANGGALPESDYRQIVGRINDLSLSAGVQPEPSDD